jgi:hypothetical protein
MTSIRSLLITVALSVIVVSLMMPCYKYNISALKSNDCPNYCDGCCVTTKPKHVIGIETIAPEGAKSANNGPILPNCTMKPFRNATLAFR